VFVYAFLPCCHFQQLSLRDQYGLLVRLQNDRYLAMDRGGDHM
jgi:hypothetical protein